MRCQITIALYAALWASGAGCSGGLTMQSGDLGRPRDLGGPAEDMTDLTAIDPLAGNPQVTPIETGTTFMYAQSPLWVASIGGLLFSDTQSNMIYQLTPPKTLAVYRPSSSGSNGLALDPQGNVVIAELTTRLVSRHNAAAMTYTTVASMFMGMPLNGPNDVTVRSDGTIYFTDPQARELGFEGLYRIAPATSTLSLLDKTMKFPDGLALSPDEKALYVAAASDAKVYKFPVNPDGSVGARGDFAQGLTNCDGVAVDDAGNVYVATPAGVRVFRDDGSPRGTLAVPGGPASNLGFGGSDRKTLFITGPTHIYQVQLAIPGRP